MKTDAPFMRTPYNYDRDQASKESGLTCKDPTLAQQQFKEEADINTLVDRFHLSGEMPQRMDLPQLSDYEGIWDFQSAMNQIRAAQEDFMKYPAAMRERFQNDPQKFLEFCSDPNNKEETYKLGLAVRPPETIVDPSTGEIKAKKEPVPPKPPKD